MSDNEQAGAQEQTDAVTQSLEGLSVKDVKEIPEEKVEDLFKKLTAIKQVDKVVIFNEGKIFQNSTEVSISEIADLVKLFDDHDQAYSKGINISGIRHEVHKFHPEVGLVYGRSGKGDQASVGAVVYRAFSNAYIAATYGYPHLSARVIPLIRKETAEF